LRCAPLPARARGRAPRELHQRRALGPGDRPSLGHGLPRRGRRAPAPLPALPVRPGGFGAVRDPVVVLLEAPGARARLGALPRRLRRLPLHRGVRPRARRLPRIPGARAHHGAVAFASHARRRAAAPRMASALAPVLDSVFPVFGLVACGVLAGRFRLAHPSASHAINQFVYAFALPAMLFIAVYQGSLEEILSGYFLLAVLAATLLTALAGYAHSRYVRRD